jgi:hypothetical protein
LDRERAAEPPPELPEAADYPIEAQRAVGRVYREELLPRGGVQLRLDVVDPPERADHGLGAERR